MFATSKLKILIYVVTHESWTSVPQITVDTGIIQPTNTTYFYTGDWPVYIIPPDF